MQTGQGCIVRGCTSSPGGLLGGNPTGGAPQVCGRQTWGKPIFPPSPRWRQQCSAQGPVSARALPMLWPSSARAPLPGPCRRLWRGARPEWPWWPKIVRSELLAAFGPPRVDRCVSTVASGQWWRLNRRKTDGSGEGITHRTLRLDFHQSHTWTKNRHCVWWGPLRGRLIT